MAAWEACQVAALATIGTSPFLRLFRVFSHILTTLPFRKQFERPTNRCPRNSFRSHPKTKLPSEGYGTDLC